jgi:pimeloyl-ACP methyl ester carboxylesterase
VNLKSALQYKTIEGLRIRYASSDKQKGDPILLLSPLPESILAFLPTWDVFSDLGTVIAVDLSAFGLSESRPDLRAPEPLGEFVIRMMEAFGLHQPHVVAPDVGTPACLFATANHPGAFKSMVIGSGATDHTDIGGILDEIVNTPSLEPYKNLTGDQFVKSAIEKHEKVQTPGFRVAGLSCILRGRPVLGRRRFPSGLS